MIMKPTILFLTTLSLLFLTKQYAGAQNRDNDIPRKNYLMLHVGLFPTDYPVYHSVEGLDDEVRLVDSYRYFGPVFGLTYGRQFNDFLAAEGHLFFSFITRTDIPDDVSANDYRTTRYGANAGLIVTPLGRWFRYVKAGIVLGYVREDKRTEWNNGQQGFHRTESYNNFAINYPLRLYALDGKRYALCGEINLQCQYEGSTYRRRTVNYTVNFAYKF